MAVSGNMGLIAFEFRTSFAIELSRGFAVDFRNGFGKFGGCFGH